MGSKKVVGHMPWGALSGFPRVQGHERVFWDAVVVFVPQWSNACNACRY